MSNYKVINTTESDLKFVFHLFEEAIAYQKRKKYSVWDGYDKDSLKQDEKDGLQYKIVFGNTILCVFSVCYTDEIIWGTKECGNAIYLHRIVVNPKHKGQKHFQKIMDWAISNSKKRELKFVRLDTWADNPNIINYYKSFGFKFIENFRTSNSTSLPSQYRNLDLALLEYELKNHLIERL